MANIKSAIKRIRTTRRKTERNKRIRSKTTTLIKKVRGFVEEKDQEKASEAYLEMKSSIDAAAQKGVIHKKKAARVNSRLAKRVQAIDAEEVHKKSVVKKKPKSKSTAKKTKKRS